MIPDSLDGWTLASVQTLLRLGITEDEQFDWKEMVPPAADDAGKLRVKEALAAFANGDGGFLVFGVKDDTRLGVDERLIGVESPDVELGRLNQYANACDPPVHWSPKTPPVEVCVGRVLPVVRVSPSHRRPHRVVDKDRSSFPLRSHGGTRQMTMIELRAQFADQSRRRRVLAFAISEAQRLGGHGKELNLAIQGQGRAMVENAIDWWMTRYDPGGLASILPDLAEIVDGAALEYVHLLLRDARASDRISEYVATTRRWVAPQTLEANHKPLLAQHAIRVMKSGKLVADQLKALLA